VYETGRSLFQGSPTKRVFVIECNQVQQRSSALTISKYEKSD